MIAILTTVFDGNTGPTFFEQTQISADEIDPMKSEKYSHSVAITLLSHIKHLLSQKPGILGFGPKYLLMDVHLPLLTHGTSWF